MDDRKIGLEFEFLAIQELNGLAVTRDHIKAIWKDWSSEKHVELYIDYGTKQPVGVIYTQKDGREVIINTDGGVCIVEFGFLPFPTLQECEENMREILAEFLVVARRHGIVLIDAALQPKTPHYFPDLKSEKFWYRTLSRFDFFSKGHKMFHNLAAHQQCVDVSYQELMPVVNSLSSIGGLTIALFANSGFGEWKVQENHSTREARWNEWFSSDDEYISRLSGIPSVHFSSFREYLQFNWESHMLAVARGKTFHVFDPPMSAIDFFTSERVSTFDIGNHCPDMVSPEMQDVNLSNMYIWIQTRPKYYFDESAPLSELLTQYDAGNVDAFAEECMEKLFVENRNIASQPFDEIMTSPAYILGLIANYEKLVEFVSRKTQAEWIALREEVIVDSMRVEGTEVLVQEVLEISKEGLEKRGFGEEKFLEPLFERVQKKESPAMRAIQFVEDEGIEAFIERSTIQL